MSAERRLRRAQERQRRRAQHRKLRTAIAMAPLMPCLLCKGEAHVGGVFAPYERPGKVAVYALCIDCFERDDVREAAERKLGVRP